MPKPARTPRKVLDAYMTPRWQTEVLLQHQPLGDAPVLLEPCSGDRSIIDALPPLPTLAPMQVWSNDLDEGVIADFHLDAADGRLWEEIAANGGIDWVITNPPFAMPTHLRILDHALRHARIGVAMIGRLSFLEPTRERGPFLAAHPPDRLLVLPRWSYTGNGATDSVTTAWMIWFVDAGWKAWAASVDPIVIANGAKP